MRDKNDTFTTDAYAGGAPFDRARALARSADEWP
jgi:hypothetical protein